MTSYLNEGLNRVAAILEEEIPGSTAKPFFFYTQTTFPYFTMRISAYKPFIDSEQLEYRPYVCIVRYVMDHVTGNTQGQNETEMYENIPVIESAFAKRNQLESGLFPTAMDGLDPTGVYCNLSQGLVEFPEAIGIGAQKQIGSEFHLHLSFAVDADQDY